MNIDEQRNKALNACIDISHDYTEEEVKKFAPHSVQVAWEIGNEYLKHMLKLQRKKIKGMTL